MSEILIYLFQASTCLAISLLLYRALFSGLTFFNWNRAVLLAILVFSATIPLMSFEGFGIGQEMVRDFTLPTFQVVESVPGESSSWTLIEILFTIYLIGALVTSARLIFGFMVSQRMIGQAKLTRFQNFWVAIHPEFIPASFFDYILMPDFDPEDPKQRQILAHESVHVRLRHSWDLLLVNLAKVVFWFNPLVYLFEKSLREVHEYQADQGVTRLVSKKEYATLLLQLISGRPGWQFMNNFNQFQTKKRILMLTRSDSRPEQKVRFLALIPAVSLLILVFACELNSESVLENPELYTKTAGIGATSLNNRLADGADEIFDIVEQQPEPDGGMAGWNMYLSRNIKYPQQARTLGIEGTVIVMFVIRKDGSITDPEILRGIGGGADEEAIRVVMEAPKWKPAYQRGRPVNVRMRLPIRFKLENGDKKIAQAEKFLPSMPEDKMPEIIVVGYGSTSK